MRLNIRSKLLLTMGIPVVIIFTIIIILAEITFDDFRDYLLKSGQDLIKDKFSNIIKEDTKIGVSLYQTILKLEGYSEEEKKELAKKIVRNIKFGTDGYYYVYEKGTGKNIIHGANHDLEGQNLWNFKDKNGNLLIQELDKVAKNDKLSYHKFFFNNPASGKIEEKYGTAEIIPETNYWIGTGVYVSDLQKYTNRIKSEINEIIGNLRFRTIAFLLAILAIVIIRVLIQSKKLSRPIVKLSTFLHESEGVNLTKRIESDNIKVKDEISDLYEMSNNMFDKFSNVVIELKKISSNVQHIGSELASSSEESVSSLNEMRSNIDLHKDQAVHLDKVINDAYKSTVSMAEYIDNVVNQINSQSTAVEESTASTEEMLASIKNIANESEVKMQLADNLQKSALSGEKEMKASMQIIKQVADSAHVIMEMITVINNIAEQTNLLAMNAAIEAAHAGDAGKGFAVVADEIRKLAETTGKNAGEISRSLKEVIDHIHTSEESTSKTGELFLKIVEGTKEVANSMLELKAATEELDTGGDQIMQALGELLKSSENVKDSSNKMNQNVSGMQNTMDTINNISAESRKGMEDLSHSIDEIYAAVDNVAQNGQLNAKNVSQLNNIVQTFKVNENKNLTLN